MFLQFFSCLFLTGQSLSFVERGLEAGLLHRHNWEDAAVPVNQRATASSAIADFDADGYLDVFYSAGEEELPHRLYRNQGDGTFIDVTNHCGIDSDYYKGGGCLFADLNDDGWPDLVIGGLAGYYTKVYLNLGDGTFEDFTEQSGLWCVENTYSISAGDFDKDGKVDLFTTHWQTERAINHLWKGGGDGRFEPADTQYGIHNPFPGTRDYTFSANFADLDKDGFPEIVVASDFGTTHVWRNEGGNSFWLDRPDMLSDENAMGSAIADFDSDGDLDWFVSCVYDYDGITEGNWGATGNRLYRNRGDGTFSEVSNAYGLRNGSWGWGSSFGDFNNDGLLDLIHTNGWPQGSAQFRGDTTRLFLATPAGRFVESAALTGLIDTAQGRGVSVWDYDEDGDLDILITNYENRPTLWRNDLNGNNTNYLKVNFNASLSELLDGWVSVYTDGRPQYRYVRCGTNFNSQNPLVLHFGLGDRQFVDSLKVSLAGGQNYTYFNLRANQLFTVDSSMTTRDIPTRYKIGPNPFADQILIYETGPVSSLTQVELYNGSGELLKELSIQIHDVVNDRAHYLLDDLSALSPGLYFLTITNVDGERITTKLIHR